MADYIHGTSEPEQGRLSLLNRITNASFLRFLGDLSGARVCDFGCGTGNMIADIANDYPDCRITGLEISGEQLAAARTATKDRPAVTLVHTDVLKNTLPDNTFDLVYCRYLLEHVADPVGTTSAMLRVAKKGGVVACQENDLHNVLYWPEIEGHGPAMKGLCDLQIALGGDPFIGRKLYSIFSQAGAADCTLTFEPEIYTEQNPEGYRAWLTNARDIFAGAREQLLERRLVKPAVIDAVISEMDRRIERPRGAALFYWNRIRAQKPA